MPLWILIVIVGSVVIDLVTSSFMFSLFAIGGLFSLLAAWMGLSQVWQIAIFILSSCFLMLIFPPQIKKLMKKTNPQKSTYEETFIGREIVLKEGFTDRATVKIDGNYWTVINEGEPLVEGDRVVITGIKGNKFIVRKKEE